MVIAGAALIKGAKSQQHHLARHRRARRARAPVALRRRARARRRRRCSTRIRARGRAAAGLGVRLLPPRRRARPPPRFPPAELDGLFPADHRMAYDMRAGAGAAGRPTRCSGRSCPTRGREMICGVGPRRRPLRRLRRQPPGPDRRSRAPRRAAAGRASSTARASPRSRSSRAPATTTASRSSGCRTSRASTSASRPSSTGLLGYGSSLIYTNSHQPRADVHGAAAQGLGRRLLRDGRAALRPGGAARDAAHAPGGDGGAHARDRRLQHQARRRLRRSPRTDPAEAERVAARDGATSRSASSATWTRCAPQPRGTSTRSSRPSELRAYLEAAVEMAYQAIGYRRVKNPRIWSLHDLAALAG